MHRFRLAGGILLVMASLAANAQDSAYSRAIPASLRGPFISDPAVVTLLECPTAACNGRLNFARLMQARSPQSASGQNPFNLPVAAKILATVKSDLTDVRVAAGATDGQLNPDFLTDLGSRVELVGAINRMDRQFIKDPTVGLSHAARLRRGQSQCREELGLMCTQLFTSANDPNVGTCVPSGRAEIGDPLQRGSVVTTAYGVDKYTRTTPVSPDQRIPASFLPAPAPDGNAYYGAHQEFYEGDD